VSDEIDREAEDFLRDADTAMYRAKESGKARCEVFDREMHAANMNLLQVETDLRRALSRNELEVFYQPILNLENGRCSEFEALIRWRHPIHGYVAPKEFISVAEESGLIIPIGRWILEEACKQARSWQKKLPQHEKLSISVNLSAKQLMHPALRGQLEDVLKKTGLNPRFLKLEVTESTVIERSETALAVLSEIKALGISLSMDDFGTGYSSLTYLHQFPFERLKIDRSFVDKMDHDPKSEAIVRTILLLGKNLKMEVVAEGIESSRQLDLLRQLGCGLGQGFLFSKPVNAAKAEKYLIGPTTYDLPQAYDLTDLLEVSNIQ
jgi:EAL domain-containing protein (putative c-di-GMP-specific phosphodiesterase class I)